MKKTLLVTATATAMIMAASSAQAMSAKRAGQGFTDIMGDFTNAANNPALMTRYDQGKDRFYTTLGIGLHLADQNDAVDSADAANDIVTEFNAATEELQQKFSAGTITAEDVESYEALIDSSVDGLRQNLTDISQDTLFLRQGADLAIAIPNRQVSTSFFASQRGRIGLKADYSESDDAYLSTLTDNLSTTGELFDENELTSKINAAGYSVADVGFAFGREVNAEKIPFLSSLGLGLSLKYQRLDVVGYESSISNFDDDDITSGDYHEYNNGFNADLGAVMTFDEDKRWMASFAVRDLKRNSVTNANGDTFKLDTRSTVGAGYQGEMFSLVGQVDLNEHGKMGDGTILDGVQYASIGAEFDFWKHAQLRAGYRTDLSSTEEDVITAGIGISPFNRTSIDIAAFTGSDRNVGGVVQFGFRF